MLELLRQHDLALGLLLHFLQQNLLAGESGLQLNGEIGILVAQMAVEFGAKRSRKLGYAILTAHDCAPLPMPRKPPL